MSNWTHTYTEQAIPGPSQSGVINNHRPGRAIAKAVTEIQERAVVYVDTELENIEDTGTQIVDNTLQLKLKVDPSQLTDGITRTVFAISGGVWPNLFAQQISIERGIIKNVSDYGETYPNKVLYTGPVIEKIAVSYSSGTLTLNLDKRQVEDGVVTKAVEEEPIEIQIPSGPPGPQGPAGPPGAFSGSGTVVIGVRYVDSTRQFQYQTGTLTATGITPGGWVTFLTLAEFSC